MIPKNLRPIADLEVDPAGSLWNGRIPIGGLTLLEGYQGVGKSTLMAHLAATVTAGRELPDMEPGEIANVFWLTGEDDLFVLKRRLIAAGADLNGVFVSSQSFTFNNHELMWLADQVAKISPALVVIDPIFPYLSGDPNKHENVRFLMSELNNIAQEFKCAIVIVRKLGYPLGHREPGGSPIEFKAAVRSVLFAGYMPEHEAPDDEERLALVQTKNSFGRNAERLQYQIQADPDSPGGGALLWKEIVKANGGQQ